MCHNSVSLLRSNVASAQQMPTHFTGCRDYLMEAVFARVGLVVEPAEDGAEDVLLARHVQRVRGHQLHQLGRRQAQELLVSGHLREVTAPQHTESGSADTDLRESGTDTSGTFCRGGWEGGRGPQRQQVHMEILCSRREHMERVVTNIHECVMYIGYVK